MMKCLGSATSIIKNKNTKKLHISATIINILLIISAGYILYNLVFQKRESAFLINNLQIKYAQVVIESENTIYPSLAVGPSLFPKCNKCYAIVGPRGHIIFDFVNAAESGVINDVHKIKIFALNNSYELLKSIRVDQGSYFVEVSHDKKVWSSLGYGYGVTKFRLGAENSLDVRYVKIRTFERPIFLDAVGLGGKKSINF